ncbi:MAG: biopolymer transporter ExbD [Opitutae bacterium]|nr:biopolymer transporter ExbD [Opitutae bacterium]|tara:strand:- start:639 stop:1052 length:414 start_codon:yes stop_codon:yes gene_type:complete
MKLYGRLRTKEERNEEDSINVSPLIDVVFILLIFFIVSATFVSLPGINVKRPKAITAESLEKNSILFALSEKDKIFYGGEEVKLAEISSLIERASKKRKKPVVVQTDQMADASLLAKVVAKAHLSSPSVSIATRKPR